MVEILYITQHQVKSLTVDLLSTNIKPGLSSVKLRSLSKFWHSWPRHRTDVGGYRWHTLLVLHWTREQVGQCLETRYGSSVSFVVAVAFHREVKVFLHCDRGASTPTATTDGDSDVILHYVRYVFLIRSCNYHGRLNWSTEIMNLTMANNSPGVWHNSKTSVSWRWRRWRGSRTSRICYNSCVSFEWVYSIALPSIQISTYP